MTYRFLFLLDIFYTLNLKVRTGNARKPHHDILLVMRLLYFVIGLSREIDFFRNVVLVNFIVERLATVLIYPQ
jgi:hypothetical protein